MKLPYGFQTYALYGNDTVLDWYGITISSGIGGKAEIDTKTEYPKEGYVLWVCGEYILELQYPSEMSLKFADIFQSVQRIQDFDPEALRAIHQMEAPQLFTLTRHPEKAAKHRSTIRSYFFDEETIAKKSRNAKHKAADRLVASA